jgi:hypothetical protein
MRFMIASLITAGLFLSTGTPALAGGKNPDACKSRCDTNYQFCVSRAVTKNAKKSCKADRKSCKSQCK